MAIFLAVLLAIIVIITLFVIFSTLRIEIEKLEIINKKVMKFKLILSLALFNRVKWIKFKIDKSKIEKIAKSSIMDKILKTNFLKDYKNIKQIKNWKKVLKELNKLEIEKLQLYSKIGTQNPCITAYLIPTLASILAIALSKKMSEPKYKIEPVYIDKNYIYLSINCIITIKLVHIINIIKLIKGKEVYQKDGRTSNRRAYANSHG